MATSWRARVWAQEKRSSVRSHDSKFKPSSWLCVLLFTLCLGNVAAILSSEMEPWSHDSQSRANVFVEKRTQLCQFPNSLPLSAATSHSIFVLGCWNCGGTNCGWGLIDAESPVHQVEYLISPTYHVIVYHIHTCESDEALVETLLKGWHDDSLSRYEHAAISLHSNKQHVALFPFVAPPIEWLFYSILFLWAVLWSISSVYWINIICISLFKHCHPETPWISAKKEKKIEVKGSITADWHNIIYIYRKKLREITVFWNWKTSLKNPEVNDASFFFFVPLFTVLWECW